MMNFEKYLVFFSTCIVSEGANRALILDLQRNNYIAIPDTLSSVIKEFKSKKSIKQVVELYGKENEKIIVEYVEFLLKDEYAILVDEEEFDYFVDFDTNFELPSIITNCIIECPIDINSSFENTLYQLSKFNCQNIQIVFYETVNVEILYKLIYLLNQIDLRSIDLVIPFDKGVLKFIFNTDSEKNRITNILVHSTPIEILKNDFKSFSVNFVTNEINSFKNCGIVNMNQFNVNKHKVLESINHNSCLHKKITIDKDGNIKNCPAMAESFGNIKNTSLEDALNKTDFKKYWNITKDQIEVCKDCEFRHVCTDCRAFIENPQDKYSKPLKCGYNPYTNVWEDWSKNPLKQKAIEYYEI